MKALLVMLLLFMTGCLKTMAPTGLAVVGGGLGSIGGPWGSALGAGGGAALGQVIKGEAEVIKAQEKAQEVIKALSEGDVEKMIELRAGEQEGIFDKVVDGIYRLLYLGGLCMALWFVLPWVWAKKHVKQTVEKHLKDGK